MQHRLLTFYIQSVFWSTPTFLILQTRLLNLCISSSEFHSFTLLLVFLPPVPSPVPPVVQTSINPSFGQFISGSLNWRSCSQGGWRGVSLLWPHDVARWSTKVKGHHGRKSDESSVPAVLLPSTSPFRGCCFIGLLSDPLDVHSSLPFRAVEDCWPVLEQEEVLVSIVVPSSLLLLDRKKGHGGRVVHYCTDHLGGLASGCEKGVIVDIQTMMTRKNGRAFNINHCLTTLESKFFTKWNKNDHTSAKKTAIALRCLAMECNSGQIPPILVVDSDSLL